MSSDKVQTGKDVSIPCTCPCAEPNLRTGITGLAEAEAGPSLYVRTGTGLGQAETDPLTHVERPAENELVTGCCTSCCCQLSIYKFVSTDDAGPSTLTCSEMINWCASD